MALVAPLDGELDARAPSANALAARAEGCGRVAVIDADGAFHQLEARGGDAALFEGDVRLAARAGVDARRPARGARPDDGRAACR